MELADHRVEAPDLPAHGEDETPIPAISLQTYVERVLEVLDAQPEPVILVGLSHGGGGVTQAAEYRADKIETLVYLYAFLPRNGESLVDLARRDPDPNNNVLPHVVLAIRSSSSSTRAVSEVIVTRWLRSCS